jgi:methylated-DNA-[protein]-cysteine S-methyltransferase
MTFRPESLKVAASVVSRSEAKIIMGTSQRICVFSTRLGWFGVVWRGQALAAVTFGHLRREQVLLAMKRLATGPEPSDFVDVDYEPVALRLRAYSEGQVDDFGDVLLDLNDLTDFQRRVSLACRTIPFGQTSTYGELAVRVGSSNAARAVGAVMARNRLPIVIPCHRVLGAAGRLGGYSAPGGLETKRRLLRLEGIQEF